MRYRLESRWPSWAPWKTASAAPHCERHPFDGDGLVFLSRASADQAAARMGLVNAGECRVVEDAGDYVPSWRRKREAATT